MPPPITAPGDELPHPPCPGGAGRVPGRLLLHYTPDGPLGGTFSCVACGAQAWQPDLLDHAAACPHRAGPPARPARQ